jgi:hypothetical protein
MSQPKQIKFTILDSDNKKENNFSPNAPRNKIENALPVIITHSHSEQQIPLHKRVFFEHFDEGNLQKLFSHSRLKENIDPSLLPMLIKFISASESGSKKVTYSRTDHGLGRLYGDCSMQSLPRWVRHTITSNLYWDIDIVNCQPTLLGQLCQCNGLTHAKLHFYIENRDLVLQEVMERYNVNRDKSKNLILRIIFGGGFTMWRTEEGITGEPTKFIKELR